MFGAFLSALFSAIGNTVLGWLKQKDDEKRLIQAGADQAAIATLKKEQQNVQIRNTIEVKSAVAGDDDIDRMLRRPDGKS